MDHPNQLHSAPPYSAKSVLLNGEAHVTEAASLAELLASMGITLEMQGIAVACNGMVAPRAMWSAQSLHDQDHIEVIRANIGG